MTPPAKTVFFNEDLPPLKRGAMHQRFSDLFPDAFSGLDEVVAYLGRILVPASRTWAFTANNKCGTTTTKRLLFELEFGTPLTVELEASDDINTDVVPQKLQGAKIFRSLATLPRAPEVLKSALRLTTVRHPASRVLSAFLYICETQAQKHPWMLQDRLRLNAMVGFDWRHDSRSAAGFVKFLRFIELVRDQAGIAHVNPHWRPQFGLIRPDVLEPNLIGRAENLAPFFSELAARLDRPLPAQFTTLHANRQDKSGAADLMTPEAEALITAIFAQDYTWLGYQPDEWRKAPA